MTEYQKKAYAAKLRLSLDDIFRAVKRLEAIGTINNESNDQLDRAIFQTKEAYDFTLLHWNRFVSENFPVTKSTRF